MIECKKVDFWYTKQNPVLQSVDLELHEGRIYGLLGKNGAGKTTLLKLLCGLRFPKAGTILGDHHQPRDREAAFLSELFLVQEEIKAPNISIKTFARTWGEFYPHYDPVLFGETLETFAVSDHRLFSKLSLGEKKKAMVAFGLACGTRYLFLDEPTNGLDIPAKAALRKMIASTLTSEKVILISTHQVRDLQTLIDSVIVLDGSRIILDQPLEKIGSKLTFSHQLIPTGTGEELFSTSGEMGRWIISANHTGVPGDVDIETLFLAATANPDQFTNLFISQYPRA